MIEDQESVSSWAKETFGKGTPERLALRAWEEMIEFCSDDLLVQHTLRLMGKREIAKRNPSPDEVADIVITLYNYAQAARFDLHEEVQRKMILNRQRRWNLNGDGTAYHEPEAAS